MKAQEDIIYCEISIMEAIILPETDIYCLYNSMTIWLSGAILHATLCDYEKHFSAIHSGAYIENLNVTLDVDKLQQSDS